MKTKQLDLLEDGLPIHEDTSLAYLYAFADLINRRLKDGFKAIIKTEKGHPFLVIEAEK